MPSSLDTGPSPGSPSPRTRVRGTHSDGPRPASVDGRTALRAADRPYRTRGLETPEPVGERRHGTRDSVALGPTAGLYEGQGGRTEQSESVNIDRVHEGRPLKNAVSFVELTTHWRDGAAPYRRGGTDERDQTAVARSRAGASGELNDIYTARLLAGARVVDALVPPTIPAVAPRVELVDDWSYDLARNTRYANVTRLPAVTLAVGTQGDEELLIGLQLVGRPFSEASLLATAARVATVEKPSSVARTRSLEK